METYLEVVNKLTNTINRAVSEGKSVTAANKRLINVAADEIRRASRALQTAVNNAAATATTTNSDNPTAPGEGKGLKEEILGCVRAEMQKHLAAVTALHKRHTAAPPPPPPTLPGPRTFAAAVATGAKRSTTTTTSATTVAAPAPAAIPNTRPAIIVTPRTATKTRQETVQCFKNAICFRNTSFAPARVQTISNNKLRVEFDTAEQRDTVLDRLRDAREVSAESARRLQPMFILKGISTDVPAEELVAAIKSQNPEVGALVTRPEDLQLRFKRSNRNPLLYNAVFLAHPKVWRKAVEAGRVSVDHQRVHVDDFSPFLQCFRCLQFGHTKAKCSTINTPCAHCADTNHTLTDCPIRAKQGAPKCANCVAHNQKHNSGLDTNHKATASGCPRLIAMKEKIACRVDYGP